MDINCSGLNLENALLDGMELKFLINSFIACGGDEQRFD